MPEFKVSLKSVDNYLDFSLSLWFIFTPLSAYHPFNTYLSTNLANAASLNETFYLMCSAEANPAAKYRLYKGDKIIANITAGSQNIGLYGTSVSDRMKEVVYKCIPFNSFGDGPTKELSVTLHCKYINQVNYVTSCGKTHTLTGVSFSFEVGGFS